MTDNPSLRILHISDLHFTSSSRKEPVWGKQISLHNNLADDIEEKFLDYLKRFLGRFSEDQWPKIVIVSGDLVEKGGHEVGEFARATQFLSELAIVLRIPDQKRIFVVPGNHDVNWYKGVNIEQRFEDYFNAVERFSSPELFRKGLRLHHEDLSNLVQDISLEITLFISPTYSGVPDETVNEIKRRVRELQEKIREVQAGDDETELHEDFKLLDIAAIGADQRRQIQPSNHADKEPIRIAVLHHHLLPDNQLEVSQFESVVDAGRTIDELIANKYDLVLTGHKHNRRLVHLRNANGTIDVYTSPSLFKDEGRGFTIIDVHNSTSPYYATLHYYNYKCEEISRERLVREGRILRQVSEACADISPPAQEEILLPVLESIKSYTNLAKNSPFENFYRGVWEQVSQDLTNIGQQHLVFRSPRIWEQWQNLIQLAQDNNEPIKLVSKNDLDYWIAAEKRHSEPDNYSQPLRQFQGEKSRILVLDEFYFKYSQEREKCIKVVNNMIEQGFQIALVPAKKILSNEVKQDFGIIGNFAVSIFEGRVDYTRSLKEIFNQDDLIKARSDWHELWQNRVWDSSHSENFEQFFDEYQY